MIQTKLYFTTIYKINDIAFKLNNSVTIVFWTLSTVGELKREPIKFTEMQLWIIAQLQCILCHSNSTEKC